MFVDRGFPCCNVHTDFSTNIFRGNSVTFRGRPCICIDTNICFFEGPFNGEVLERIPHYFDRGFPNGVYYFKYQKIPRKFRDIPKNPLDTCTYKFNIYIHM